MFHHRGTSTRGCLTRRMECLLLLLGRQQTAGWESGQEERQESKSECQLAGLRLPAHTHINTHSFPCTSACKYTLLYTYKQTCAHIRPVTLFMLRNQNDDYTRRTHACTCTQRDARAPNTHWCRRARRVPWQRVFSTAQACDTEAEGICCGLLLD